MKKLLIFQFRTDKSLKHERECFRAIFAEKDVEIKFVNLLSTDEPKIPSFKKIGEYSGIIIAGSGQYNVTDWSTFVEKRSQLTYPIIRYAISNCIPVLGICYGHQLIAVALGGSVERDSMQAEVGSAQIQLNELGIKDDLFADIPEHFYAMVGHQDSVVELPKDAVNLANSQKASIQSYRIRDCIYGVQFHPELDLERLLFRLSLYPGYMQGRSLDEVKNTYHEIPYAEQVLHNFLDKVAV